MSVNGRDVLERGGEWMCCGIYCRSASVRSVRNLSRGTAACSVIYFPRPCWDHLTSAKPGNFSTAA